MTTLVVSVGQRLLPILGHALLHWPQLVLSTFVLMTADYLLRVLTELATPQSTTAFTARSLFAVLELSTLVLFSANVLRTLLTSARSSAMDEASDACNLRVRSVPREFTLGTSGHE